MKCHDHKRSRLMFFGVGILLGLSTLSSCESREEPLMEDSKSIRFEVSEVQQPNSTPNPSGVRSSEDRVTNYEVVEMQGGTTPFYLHIEEKDSFPTASLSDTLATPATRATPVNTSTMYDSFGLFAGKWSGNSSWAENKKADFIYHQAVSKSNSWKTTSTWPGSGTKVRFFGYAPYGAQGVSFPGQAQAGTPRLSYTVPANVAQQLDLLAVATTDYAGDHRGAVPLRFKHICTAVRFVTDRGILPGKITRVALIGVFNSGTHSLGSDSWTPGTSKADFVQNLNVDVNGATEQVITQGEKTFMMMPQTLPPGAALEVDYVLYGQKQTLRASIAQQKWVMGKTVTYRISLNSITTDYNFSVKINNQAVSQWVAPRKDGGTFTLNVVSEKVLKRHNTVLHTGQQPWTVEYSLDGGANWQNYAPHWLAYIPRRSDGSMTKSVTVSPQEQTELTAVLRSTPSIQGVMDLSDPGNTGGNNRNTANCYIVNAAGTYKFPLVYGNAVKNGRENTSAYQYPPGDNGGWSLGEFRTHSLNPIKDPWIHNQGNRNPRITGAELLWQDVSYLVKDVKLVDNNNFIQFTIDQNSIDQGNAVIAVKAGGTILWSWHIWVTPINPQLHTMELTDPYDPPYVALMAPLGWVEAGPGYYIPRSVKVRVKQEGTQNQHEFTIVQRSHVELSDQGGGNYYQWGRKDPFARVNIQSGRVEMYTSNGQQTSHNTIGGLTQVDAGIQNPKSFITSYTNWNGTSGWYGKIFNLWNNRLTYGEVNADSRTMLRNEGLPIKTVYDPCPVGFSVPPIKMLSAYFGRFLSRNALQGFRNNTNSTISGRGTEGTFWSSESSWIRTATTGDYAGVNFHYNRNSAASGEASVQYTGFGHGVWPVQNP